MIQNKCGQVTLMDGLPTNCRKMRSLLLTCMQTWGSRILPGSWSYANWWWNLHWKGNREKESWIDTQVWKRLAACKTEMVTVLVSLSPEPPHHSLSCLYVKSLLDYLCNPVCSLCVVCVCDCCRHQVLPGAVWMDVGSAAGVRPEV